jgi:hypothetical protein
MAALGSAHEAEALAHQLASQLESQVAQEKSLQVGGPGDHVPLSYACSPNGDGGRGGKAVRDGGEGRMCVLGLQSKLEEQQALHAEMANATETERQRHAREKDELRAAHAAELQRVIARTAAVVQQQTAAIQRLQEATGAERAALIASASAASLAATEVRFKIEMGCASVGTSKSDVNGVAVVAFCIHPAVHVHWIVMMVLSRARFSLLSTIARAGADADDAGTGGGGRGAGAHGGGATRRTGRGRALVTGALRRRRDGQLDGAGRGGDCAARCCAGSGSQRGGCTGAGEKRTSYCVVGYSGAPLMDLRWSCLSLAMRRVYCL